MWTYLRGLRSFFCRLMRCRFFATHKEMDFARAGFEATQLVTLPEGPLPQFSHAIEPHLRQLGLPTSLKNGMKLMIFFLPFF